MHRYMVFYYEDIVDKDFWWDWKGIDNKARSGCNLSEWDGTNLPLPVTISFFFFLSAPIRIETSQGFTAFQSLE